MRQFYHVQPVIYVLLEEGPHNQPSSSYIIFPAISGIYRSPVLFFPFFFLFSHKGHSQGQLFTVLKCLLVGCNMGQKATHHDLLRSKTTGVTELYC